MVAMPDRTQFDVDWDRARDGENDEGIFFKGIINDDDWNAYCMVNTTGVADLYGIDLVNDCHRNVRPFLARLKKLGINEVMVISGSMNITKSGEQIFCEPWHIDNGILFVAIEFVLDRKRLEEKIQREEKAHIKRETVRTSTGTQALRALHAEAVHNGATAPPRVMHDNGSAEKDPENAYRGAREAVVKNIVAEKFPGCSVRFTDRTTLLFNVMDGQTYTGRSGHINLSPPFRVIINKMEYIDGKWRVSDVLVREENIIYTRSTV